MSFRKRAGSIYTLGLLAGARRQNAERHEPLPVSARSHGHHDDAGHALSRRRRTRRQGQPRQALALRHRVRQSARQPAQARQVHEHAAVGHRASLTRGSAHVRSHHANQERHVEQQQQ